MSTSKYLGFKSCDTIRGYNSLEPRPRQEDFERSLSTEVYDPLWMLTRQWQFGELQGEDTGSAIFAKVCLQNTKITQFKSGNQQPESFDDTIVLEKKAEAESIIWDYKIRLQTGLKFKRMLKKVLISASAFNAVFTKALELYAIEKPDDISLQTDSDELVLEKARVASNIELSQWLEHVNGKAIDGVALLLSLNAGGTLPAAFKNIILNTHIPKTEATTIKLKKWFVDTYGESLFSQVQSAWVKEQMEYQFACALPNTSGDNTVLTATEYYDGNLDWYAFDVAANPENDDRLDDLAPRSDEDSNTNISQSTFTVIPTEARFAGMPSSRWWEFEDGAVDLTNLNAETTDIAKIVMTQFALMYSNDWFVVPYDVPAGSLSRVRGIVVTDVFGQKTFVEPAAQGETDDWMTWGMFNLSTEQLDKEGALPTDTRLFVPPVTPKTHESDPISEVNMLRDEMANMVWGIENTIFDGLGRGRDGHAAAVAYKKFINELVPPIEAVEPVPSARLQYELGNEVPENWIPFVVRQSGNDNRSIVLQRASMPRLFRDNFTAVRPQTDILRYGIKRKAQKELWPFVNSEGDKQDVPYFLNEEEVPRAGSFVRSSFQRTRWYHGAIHEWYGRRKEIGRGEAGSGLLYDSAKPIKN